ncbi:pyruvate synthase [Candidatus Bathyarchaeota archaeon]|nr:MAG: pyruvate synthase [Candidatus Bathyarchaeota archaeon]
MEKFKLNPKPTWKELPIASIIPQPATSRFYKTGDWRSFRPIVDKKKCTRCGLCWVYCPDGAIRIVEDGSYEVDLDYCKGCGICAEECPVKAISMVEEVEE